MATHISAEKRVRQTVLKTEQNRVHVSRMRTAIRKVEDAVRLKDKEKAAEAFRAAQPLIIKVGARNITHKRTASRKVSRLAAQVKSI